MDHLVAYIDVGSGSLIVQVVIASVIAVPYFLRAQLSRGLRTIRIRSDRGGPAAPDESEAR